jgi:hypothetical protein
VTTFLVDPLVKRLGGARPSRLQAFGAAAVAGVGAGVLVYRVLRSGDEDRQRRS